MKGTRDARVTPVQLQTKYRELQEQFQTLRHRYVLIECAWCKTHIRWQRKKHPSPDDTSHGICPRCFEDVSRGLGVIGGSEGCTKHREPVPTASLLPH
jgi:hypothetical protein